jgi:sulfatase modifying factor 1
MPVNFSHSSNCKYETCTHFSIGDEQPNTYGLHNMAGSVSEWTATGIEDTSPDDQEISLSWRHSGKKVTSGGSWMDEPKNIQIGARDYQYADSSNAYTGFRCVFTGVFTQL